MTDSISATIGGGFDFEIGGSLDISMTGSHAQSTASTVSESLTVSRGTEWDVSCGDDCERATGLWILRQFVMKQNEDRTARGSSRKRATLYAQNQRQRRPDVQLDTALAASASSVWNRTKTWVWTKTWVAATF